MNTAFSVQNIIDAHGFSITITGMAIVFTGLAIVSAYIALFPLVLNIFSGELFRRRKAAKAVEKSPPPPPESSVKEPVNADLETPANTEDDLAGLIGLVLHLEQERYLQLNNLLLTIQRDPQQPSLWRQVGTLRTPPRRRSNAKI
jgi:Na+-transporting methylmalonyl-CoA/oxaloacetate decarboxylase gamma subunit